MPVRFKGGGGGSVAGAANATANLISGIVLRIVAVFRGNPIAAGIVLTLGSIRAQVLNTPGLALTPRVAGATIKPVQIAGMVVNTAATTPSGVPPTKPVAGAKITQHTVTLTRLIGVNVEAQSGVTGNGFANIANAQGLHDGTLSTLTGSAVSVQAGTLTGSYVDPDSTKAIFTIVSVKLSLRWSIVGDVLSTAVVTRSYKSGALGQTALGASVSGNVDHTGAPEVFDITAVVGGDWSRLNGFQAIFTGYTPLGSLATVNLDAVELEVVTAVVTTLQ